MSKHKYEMWVSAGFGGTARSEEFDLVDDWGYDESDLDCRTEDDILEELEGAPLGAFMLDNVDCGVRRVR